MTGKALLDLLEHNFAKELRYARAWIEKDDVYAEMHDWLQQFAVGHGLDIASGNFPTMLQDESGPCISVDGAVHLGNMFLGFKHDAANLSAIDTESCNFVLCNYLEGVDSVLGSLVEWHRVLQPGGVLALIAADAESETYAHHKGPLTNKRRLHVFTELALTRYLERALFQHIKIERHKNQLRVKAVK